MGFRFRKRIKIAPGVSINLTSKGVSSGSVGGKGVTLNVGKDGTKATTSIPGTGISYSQRLSAPSHTGAVETVEERASTSASQDTGAEVEECGRRVGLALGVGILLLPYIFSWVLLQKGYSQTARVISFLWLGCFVLSYLGGHR